MPGSGSPNAAGHNRQSDIIDEQHLARMTLGDPRLEQEVLELFLKQAALVLGRIAAESPASAAEGAHALKGSARGIGAWRLARAAQTFERALANAVRPRGQCGNHGSPRPVVWRLGAGPLIPTANTALAQHSTSR